MFLVTILLTLVVAINCVNTFREPAQQIKKEIKSVEIKDGKIIDYIKDSTVAIYSKDNSIGIDLYIVKCGGVWIDDNTVLTAGHCVDDGNIVYYETWQEVRNSNNILLYAKKALVLKIDTPHDLALLTSIDDPGSHKYTRINDFSEIGDAVRIVGHPDEYPFTYVNGTLSAKRYITNPRETKTGVLQIAAPIWFGYSGGGVFNSKGQLLGICSYISRIVPQTSFFVDADEINRFIGR